MNSLPELKEKKVLNALSVDVEEYYHAENLRPYYGREQWGRMPSRVVDSVKRTLALLERFNTKATFFALGLVAKENPEIISEIAEQGHEIASHGFEHKLAYLQTPEEFYRDVSKSKKIIEDIIGREVRGYRAPNFSIIESNEWAFDKLIEAGYSYDSSIYPIWHPRYANTKKGRVPAVIVRKQGKIVEVPLATATLPVLGRQIRLPVAGGAYWRLLPFRLISSGLSRINLIEKAGGCCYFHPWELDGSQPVPDGISFLTRLRHYGGIKNFPRKLETLFTRFKFAPVWELVEKHLKSR